MLDNSSFSLAPKFVPLLDQIADGIPQRTQNSYDSITQLLVSIMGTTSKWTARVVRQVKRKPQRFSMDRLTVTKKGPKKATSVFEKRDSLKASLFSGSFSITGVTVSAFRLWHVTHLETICLKVARSLTTARRCSIKARR